MLRKHPQSLLLWTEPPQLQASAKHHNVSGNYLSSTISNFCLYSRSKTSIQSHAPTSLNRTFWDNGHLKSVTVLLGIMEVPGKPKCRCPRPISFLTSPPQKPLQLEGDRAHPKEQELSLGPAGAEPNQRHMWHPNHAQPPTPACDMKRIVLRALPFSRVGPRRGGGWKGAQYVHNLKQN